MNAKFIQLQITFPQTTDAETVAKFLVEERWAACAQIVGEIESYYRWKEKLEIETEVLLLVKTRTVLFEKIVAEISRRHSYECPQIVAVPLELVSPSYEKWLDSQIRTN